MENPHKISTFSAVLMNINMMIGVGAFFGPALMARTTGGWGFIVWLLVALIFAPVVAAVVRAARYVPHGAGVQSYTEYLLGGRIASLAAISYTVGFFSVAALQLDCFGDELSKIFPSISQPVGVVAGGILALIIHLGGIRAVSIFQNTATFAKLIPFAAVILSIPFTSWKGVGGPFPTVHGIVAAFPIALFGYWGFESATSISDKVKGGVGKSVAIGFALTAALYSLFHFGLLKAIGAAGILEHGISSLGTAVFGNSSIIGKALNELMRYMTSLAYFSSMVSVIAVVSSLSIGIIFGLENFGKSATPSRMKKYAAAILFTAVAMALLLNSKAALTAASNIGVIFGFMGTAAGLMKRELEGKDRLWKWLSLLALVASIVLFWFSWKTLGKSTSVRILNILPTVIAVLLLQGAKEIVSRRKSS